MMYLNMRSDHKQWRYYSFAQVLALAMGSVFTVPISYTGLCEAASVAGLIVRAFARIRDV
jgi:hypothetical protein